MRGAESRCPFERWKTKLGWIVSELERQKEIKACKELLKLAREIESNGHSFDRKLTEEEIKKLGEEGKPIPKIINLIEQLDELYNDPESRITNKGYPDICLAALEVYPMPITGETIKIEIAGYQDSKKQLVSNLSFQEYSMNLQTEIQKVYGSKGPFYQLMNKISDILENRYTDLITKINTIKNTVESAFNFTTYAEIIDIDSKEDMTKEEKELVTQDRKTKKSDSFQVPNVQPGKAQMPLLTNDPFFNAQVFSGFSVNVSDLQKRFLHLEMVLGFAMLGFRAMKGDKKNRKWFSIRLKKDKHALFKKVHALTSALATINYIISREAETKAEKNAIFDLKLDVEECLKHVASKLYALTSYILSFQPKEFQGGTPFVGSTPDFK